MVTRSFKIGRNREQMSPLPACLEDYVGTGQSGAGDR
jgi:hypothetical protein